MSAPSVAPHATSSTAQPALATAAAAAPVKKDGKKHLLPTVIPDIIVDDKGDSRYVTGKLLGEVTSVPLHQTNKQTITFLD